jgi:hypothetical protein
MLAVFLNLDWLDLLNDYADLLSAIGSLSAVLFSLWYAVWRNPRKSYVKVTKISFDKEIKAKNNYHIIVFKFKIENNSENKLRIQNISICDKPSQPTVAIDISKAEYLRGGSSGYSSVISYRGKEDYFLDSNSTSEVKCEIAFHIGFMNEKNNFEKDSKYPFWRSKKPQNPDSFEYLKYILEDNQIEKIKNKYRPYLLIKNSLYDQKIRIPQKVWRDFKREFSTYWVREHKTEN